MGRDSNRVRDQGRGDRARAGLVGRGPVRLAVLPLALRQARGRRVDRRLIVVVLGHLLIGSVGAMGSPSRAPWFRIDALGSWDRFAIPAPFDLAFGACAGALVGALILAALRTIELRVEALRELGDDLSASARSTRDRAPVITSFALLAAVAEELFFRACLLGRAGIVVSTIAFALAHISFGRRWWAWSALAAAAGFAFGMLYLATGSLVAPIVAHFVVNLGGRRAWGAPESEGR